MLCRLSIRNYAIIDSLEISFSPRLNILTGETGAGKSIIVGALGLILGQRADGSVLLNRESKCIVEGSFTGHGNDRGIRRFFRENELDEQDEIIIRREISPAGKSRAFINDTPVNLAQLNRLSSLLVDLHQQFDALELGEADFQRDVLDALAGHADMLDRYRAAYHSMRDAQAELEELKSRKLQFERDADYTRFQYGELEEAAFRENELEELDAELRILSSSEAIREALDKAVSELEGSEQPVLRRLRSVCGALQSCATVLPELESLVARLDSAHVELQDIATEASRLLENIEPDESRMEFINERISLGYRLLRKHGVRTTGELLRIRDALQEKLREVLHIDDAIEAAEKAFEAGMAEASAIGREISAGRKRQADPLEQQVNRMLARVGMPNARLKVEIQDGGLSAHGMDDISFLFDANRSQVYQQIRRVASGGELSRLMLCIKSMVAAVMNMPTLIFDEIDSGISGEAARQVGVIMKQLAAARQVICITHQPQIAGRADAHFLVYKSSSGKPVRTGVRLLDTDERIRTVATMLAGDKPTAAAMENAREMITE